jgi:hypothetical protein
MSRALKRRIEKLERAANAKKLFIIDRVAARELWRLYQTYDPRMAHLQERLWEKIKKIAGEIRCPPRYGGAQAAADYQRMDELGCRRHHSETEKELSEAEEDEEYQATARYLVYYLSPRGQRRQRIQELVRTHRSAAEQRELDRLCHRVREDGENWPTRRDQLMWKPVFERTPAEILELDALSEQYSNYRAEHAMVRALQNFQLQERSKKSLLTINKSTCPVRHVATRRRNLKQEGSARTSGRARAGHFLLNGMAQS